jgi:ribosomal protein S18 acetylase RimI-like enzyme
MIRQATPADAAALTAMYNDRTPEEGRRFTPNELFVSGLPPWRTTEERFAEVLSAPSRYDVVFEVDGALAGWGFLSDGELLRLGVMRDARHHGGKIGRQIVEHLQGHARQRSKGISLSVVATNDAALLYEDLGFVIVRRIKKSKTDGQPYLFMEWHPER